MIVGLTGGIGTGKSTVSKLFKENGADIYDADIIAKEIMEELETIEEIGKEFGSSILDKNQRLDRQKLKEIVFKNKEKLEILNKIVHPKVIKRFENIKSNIKKEEIAIFDIPLLFEAKMENLCDLIVVVDIDREKQIERIIERDGIEEELAEKIIDSQMSSETKRKKADIVIENNGTLIDLEKKVFEIYRKIVKRRGK